MNSLCSCPSLIVTILKLLKLFEAPTDTHKKKDEKKSERIVETCRFEGSLMNIIRHGRTKALRRILNGGQVKGKRRKRCFISIKIRIWNIIWFSIHIFFFFFSHFYFSPSASSAMDFFASLLSKENYKRKCLERKYMDAGYLLAGRRNWPSQKQLT